MTMTEPALITVPPVETDSWIPIDLASLPERQPIKPDLGGIGIVYPGKRHVFSGPPESAKTLAAYAIGIHVVRHAGPVILIDFEMGAYDARGRLRELGATDRDLAGFHYLEPDQPATDSRVQHLVELRPRLVIIDAAAGAYDLQGLDDNKRGDVERLSRLYVSAFWRSGIATIFIDHVVKNTETRGKFVIGSERKLGGADVHLGFEAITPISRGSTGLYKIVTHKDRGGWLKRGNLAELELESDPDSHDITWTFRPPSASTDDAGHFRPTHLMEKVSINLELRSEAATRNSIAQDLGGNRQYILAAITALVSEGFAVEEDGTNRSRPVRSIRPFRENDPDCNPKNGSTMRPEPQNQLPYSATNGWRGDLAQPSGGSVVPGGSRVVPEPHDLGGSSGSPPYGGDTTDTTQPEPPQQGLWFRDLAGDDLAYLETLAPDTDEDDLNGN